MNHNRQRFQILTNTFYILQNQKHLTANLTRYSATQYVLNTVGHIPHWNFSYNTFPKDKGTSEICITRLIKSNSVFGYDCF
jgi:hypothetical protein